MHAMGSKESGRSISLSSAFLTLSLVAGCAAISPPPPPVAPDAAARVEETDATRARRSPFTEPPGAFFAVVTQANITTTICVSGWTATVRPSTSFTQALKKLMLSRAGLDPKAAIQYELDHFIPLAIGGHPRSEDNLWLQRWDGEWNARIKDRLERRLQVMVCAGQITLHTARVAVQDDWHTAYRKYVAADAAVLHREIEMDEAEVVE